MKHVKVFQYTSWFIDITYPHNHENQSKLLIVNKTEVALENLGTLEDEVKDNTYFLKANMFPSMLFGIRDPTLKTMSI